MVNYFGIIYNRTGKITHKKMKLYLEEKEVYCPKSVPLNIIKYEDILTGKYVGVIDETNKIIFYQNPLELSRFLVYHLCHKKDELEERRKAAMNSELAGKKVGEEDYLIYLAQSNKRRIKTRKR
jgi:hypothetical protein